MRTDPDLRLSSFEPFAALGRSELDLVRRHARRLQIPSRRWLLRPGRTLRGHHFLLRGSVATVRPTAIVSAGQAAAKKALYPGAIGLRTLKDSEFLQVPASVIELLDHEHERPLIAVGEATDCWQTRFLGSDLMTSLPPVLWQRLLTGLEPTSFARGAWVIREGEQHADGCYVLTAGTARVQRAGRMLARLTPGDLFGEDALITGEPRNASIQMELDGQVMTLAADDFRRFLIGTLLEGVYAEPSTTVGVEKTLLRFGSSRDLRERIARLPASGEYLISSSLPEVESLAIFLMRKRGLIAWAAPRP